MVKYKKIFQTIFLIDQFLFQWGINTQTDSLTIQIDANEYEPGDMPNQITPI